MRATAVNLVRASTVNTMRASPVSMLRATPQRADGFGPNQDPFIKGRLGVLKDPQVERFAEMRQNMGSEWEWNRKSVKAVFIYVFLIPGLIYWYASKTTYNQPSWRGILEGEPTTWPEIGTPEREEYLQAYLKGNLAELHASKQAAALGPQAEEEEEDEE